LLSSSAAREENEAEGRRGQSCSVRRKEGEKEKKKRTVREHNDVFEASRTVTDVVESLVDVLEGELPVLDPGEIDDADADEIHHFLQLDIAAT
jgi:hypothetical protein